MEYEVIKANSQKEAMDGSKYKIGCLVPVIGMACMPNSNGTYTVTVALGDPVSDKIKEQENESKRISKTSG